MTRRLSAAVIAALLAAAQLSIAGAETRSSPNTLRLEPGAEAAPARIADLAWLAGYWKGPGLGGVSEEIWAPPTVDRMYGSYSLTKDGKVVFSEAMMLVETAGSVVLRVKHFTPDFVGWEEKDGYVTFPLVRTGDREVWFSGLTFRRRGDLLTIYLVLSSEGTRTEHEFQLERVPL